jgi:signal transduction histidine kinase
LFNHLPDAKDFEGTGIGFELAKRFITQHGGNVWAEGKTGDWAKFLFSLPNLNE